MVKVNPVSKAGEVLVEFLVEFQGSYYITITRKSKLLLFKLAVFTGEIEIYWEIQKHAKSELQVHNTLPVELVD